MSGKKTTKASAGDLQTLRIGSRVRCIDDRVEGRIVWANGTVVKIKWDDGEQVTWKRDSLAGRPIEILDATDEDRQPEPSGPEQTPATDPIAEQATATPDQATTETPVAEQVSPAPETPTATEAPVAVQVSAVPEPPAPTEATVAEPAPALEQTEAEDAALDTSAPAETSEPAKPKRQRKAKAPPEPKEKKLSALDAAARVLGEEGRAMTCKEMIEAMAAKGYWTSPGGQTPEATLYSAILREVTTKGADARFTKTERGKFGLKS